MTLTESLLILLVVVLTIVIFRKPAAKSSGTDRAWDCVDKSNGDVTSVKLHYNNATPEASTTKENAEHFDGSDSSNSTCDPNDTLAYASHPFGNAASFTEWALNTGGIDPSVVKNHSEFVKDQVTSNDGSSAVTGRTYSPDSHDSWQPISWVGIRGPPQAVPIGNPTQQPEINGSFYSNGPKLSWSST